MPLLAKIFTGLIALLRVIPMPQGDAGNKSAGALGGLGALGAIGGMGMWLLGPGREWHITLNAMELGFVALVVSMLIEWARNLPPPGGQ